MEGGGPLTIIVGLMLMPLLMWQERTQRFQRLSPVEQNLQRASHGFAVVAFVLLALFGMYGWRGVLNFFPWLYRDPADAWVGLLFLVPLAYGSARCLYGVRRSVGMRDGLLAFRAFTKLAVGLAGSWFFWRVGNALGRSMSLPAALVWALLMGVSAWMFITGSVRFAVLVLSPRVTAFVMVQRNIAAQTVVWRTGRRPWRGRAMAFVAGAIAGVTALWHFWK
jgi:hypothetical protein